MKKQTVILTFVSLVMVCVLFFLPVLTFTSQLYTKRSPNTFVGDEKYQQARAEAEEVLKTYEDEGIRGTLDEEVIERVNSKGVTTSLVVFTIRSDRTRTFFDLLKAGLPGSFLLGLLLVFLLCAWIMTWTAGVCDKEKAKRILGTAAAGLALAAMFLVPAVFQSLNLTLSRQVDLFLGNRGTVLSETRLARLDAFLFEGQAGDKLRDMLGALAYTVSPFLFLFLLPGFMTLCAAAGESGRQIRKMLLRILLYVSVIFFSVFILYPFFVMFITAFRSNAETTDMYFLSILPQKWMFSNLKDTLDRGVLRYLINSLCIAGGATCISMLCGIPAAYAMARMDFRGRKAYLGFVIMSQMFSPVVLLVGISRLMNTLHLNDTLPGLMFINAAFNQAFAIWLLRGTFVSISSEMEQAACIDGCSVAGALVRILLPMAAPGIVTTLIFVFINSWNEYTVSTVLISTQTKRPITVGITQFSSFNMIEWQYLFTAALLATVPVVILFMLIEKHLAAGLTAGGVKG